MRRLLHLEEETKSVQGGAPIRNTEDLSVGGIGMWGDEGDGGKMLSDLGWFCSVPMKHLVSGMVALLCLMG